MFIFPEANFRKIFWNTCIKKTRVEEKPSSENKGNPDNNAQEVKDNPENTANVSGKGWTEDEENRFMRECTSTAGPRVGATRANEYCDCMLQKIKVKYKSYQQANQELLNSEDMNIFENECNSQ